MALSRFNFGFTNLKENKLVESKENELNPAYEWVIERTGQLRQVALRTRRSLKIQYPFLTTREVTLLSGAIHELGRLPLFNKKDRRPLTDQHILALYKLLKECPKHQITPNEDNWIKSLWDATLVRYQVSYRDLCIRPYKFPLKPIPVYTVNQEPIAFLYMYEQCLAWRNDRRDQDLPRKPDPSRYHGAVHTVEEWCKIHTQIPDLDDDWEKDYFDGGTENILPSYEQCTRNNRRHRSSDDQEDLPRYEDI